MKKIILSLFFALMLCCSIGLIACGDGKIEGKTELTKELPQEVVCGSEIYFKEYLPIDFDAEYELTVSYLDYDVDYKTLEKVENEKVDSLMFRFNDVSKYDFKLNKVGTDPISFSINSVPVVPELLETSEWQTDKDETVLIEDIAFWCNINLKDEDAKIDSSYKLEFIDVEVNSILVDGTSSKQDLSGVTSYTFEEEAEYVFTIKASNISGEHKTTVKVTTMDLDYHSNEISGYVFDESNKIEFDVNGFETFELPADGETLKVRVNNDKYDAVYSSNSKSFFVSNFTQELEKGKNQRLCIADKEGNAYSTIVLVPDLAVTKENIKELETIKGGVVILAEDIDMSEVSNYGESRTGAYADYWFTGIFDGRGHTISNYTALAPGYAGSLFWSVEGATIKNVIFENAKVLRNNSVVSGRTRGYSKFINIALEVNELTTENSSAISGPGDYGSYYENCIIFVKNTPSASISKSGFINGLYCRSAEFNNSYLVSDISDLPVAPSGHAEIEPVITGSYERLTLSEAEEKYRQEYDWGTPLLNKAASIFFSGPVITNIDSENIDILLTATEGYYRLTEDIDMTGKTWAPAVQFVGTIDGNGHKIKNFTSPSASVSITPPGGSTRPIYPGLVCYTGIGATIKNLDVHFVTNSIRGGLIGQVWGETTVENVNVIYDSFVAYYGGAIANVIQGTLNVKDTNIVIKSATSSDAGKATYSGFIAGGEANTHNVVLSNVVCYNPTSLATSAYVPVNTSNKLYDEIGTLGVDGQSAVAGEDYIVYLTKEALLAAHEAGDVSDEFIANSGVMNFISQENIEDLLTATGGDYYLTEDIDLTGITWEPTAVFAGTLDGKGFKISNLNGNLFKGINNAKICNLILDNVTVTGNGGVLSKDNISSNIEITDVVVKVIASSGARAALLGYQVGGTATLTNVVIDMFTSASNIGYRGFLTTHAANVAILENVYFVGEGVALHATLGTHATLVPSYKKVDGSTDAVENTDYFIGETINDVLILEKVNNFNEDFKSIINKSYEIAE